MEITEQGVDPATESAPPARRISFAARMAPYATVFVSSACIMVIELVAGRLVSRYIGQSLYTWTTIIGVVLAGISLGNYVGGWLADRFWGRRALGLQFLLAAVACLSMFPANNFFGQLPLLAQWSWPARIFVHILFTFIVPSALLGTISPVIAKRALRFGLATGRTIGGVYAWATAGSIIGTFLTGFYLLTVLGATAVAGGAAAILAVIGVLYLACSLMFPRSQISIWERACPGSSASMAGSKQSVSANAFPNGNLGTRMMDSGLFGPLATVFLANGCVMLMEIVAGRLIARYYGQSLYSWTAVIGVILAGMSLGSYVGGRLADRYRTDRLLGYLLVLGSISCLAVSIITKLFVYSQAMIALSWPAQIQIHCMGALFVPSLILGAVAPVVVKIALGKGLGAGRTIGAIYAWGSVGSILGTFLAGYWLIAAIGSLLTLYLAAILLAILGVVYARRVVVAYAWVLACGVMLFFTVHPVEGVFGQYLSLSATPAQDAIYSRESQYSFIAVLADPNQPNIRQMNLDHLIHSKIDLDNPTDLQYEYEFTYAAILDKYYPAPKPMTAMVIGGGGYAFPHYLELTRPGSHVEVAEIDPAVTEAAHAEFGLPRDTTIQIHNMDARNRVADLLKEKRAGAPGPVFDCIFGDSINDYSVPYHLTTREFNQGLYELLADNGMYLFNLIDLLDSGQFIASVVNTCRQTFPYVYAFSSHEDPAQRDTFIVVASKRPLDVADVPDLIHVNHPTANGKYLPAGELDALIERTGRHILTDDFAPVENMLAPVVRNDVVRVDSYLNYADEALGKKSYDQAIDYCRVAIRLNPKSAEAHEMIGIAFTAQDRLSAAIDELSLSIECNPQRATAYDALGSAQFKKGDRAAATQAWNQAIALNADSSKPYENFGGALVKWGQPDEAIPLLNKALELDSQSATARVSLATAFAAKGDVAGAARELNAVLDANPNCPGIHPQLAQVYWKQKEFDKAWQEVDKAAQAGEPIGSKFLDALKRDSGRLK